MEGKNSWKRGLGNRESGMGEWVGLGRVLNNKQGEGALERE